MKRYLKHVEDRPTKRLGSHDKMNSNTKNNNNNDNNNNDDDDFDDNNNRNNTNNNDNNDGNDDNDKKKTLQKMTTNLQNEKTPYKQNKQNIEHEIIL